MTIGLGYTMDGPHSCRICEHLSCQECTCAAGNVYTVRIGRHPSCSCPDAAKGNVCKHHLYIMMRVLRLAPDDPCVWQRALLSAEVTRLPQRTCTRSHKQHMQRQCTCFCVCRHLA